MNTLLLLAIFASSSAMPVVTDENLGWEFSRDQQTWRKVDLPHDWAIEGPFDAENGDPATGKLPWKGIGYYRKHWVLAAPPENRRVFFEFDGIMCEGTVFVNDQPCGHRAYGYLGLTADATPYLVAGTNTVLVRADTTKLSSRWYPGAGIYRDVRRLETSDVYIERDRITVSTRNVTDESANVFVDVNIVNRRPKNEQLSVAIEIFSPNGERVVRSEPRAFIVEAGDTSGIFDSSINISKPERWRMEDNAKLYTAKITLMDEAGRGLDSVTLRIGIRDFKFDAENGFILNGERVQLHGVCLHSDLGILGMAFNKSAMRRQLRHLKDLGVNAIKTAHNPPAPEVLDLCDEMGIFVWDECFDKWDATSGRGEEPLEEFVERNLRDFVRRDRHHPSVFVWSIGNEIPSGEKSALGTTAERCARFRAAVLDEDVFGGRPVGLGSCTPEAVGAGDYASLDITGWNYRELYQTMKKAYPDKPLVYSESCSAYSVYGCYAERLPTNTIDYALAELSVDSYDRNAASWGDIADVEFERMARDKFVAGEFVWSGIDYLGEPAPYSLDWVWGLEGKLAPVNRSRSAYFGILDLLALPKDRAYLYRSYWNRQDFTLHIVPDHWTFPDRVGKRIPVYVYTSANEAELFVNGVSQGRRRKDPTASSQAGDYYGVLSRYRLIWDDVTYQPGDIRCVAYGENGKMLGSEQIQTAGEPVAVRLEPESSPDNRDELAFIKVTIVDANGTMVPGDNRRVNFTIEGSGEIVAVGNGNPRGYDSFKEVASHPLHNGRAGLFLRRKGMDAICLTATAEGLMPKTIVFDQINRKEKLK